MKAMLAAGELRVAAASVRLQEASSAAHKHTPAVESAWLVFQSGFARKGG